MEEKTIMDQKMTESEFIDYFKGHGFKLYKDLNVEEKLRNYEALKDNRDAYATVLDKIEEIVRPKSGENIVDVIKHMREDLTAVYAVLKRHNNF